MSFRDPAFGGTYGISKSGKCLAGNCEVLLADGRVVTVATLVETKDATPVVALDANHKMVPAGVSQFYVNGAKDIVHVGTADGRRIWVTPNHPLLTQRGWVCAGDLKGTDLLAVPRKLDFFGADDRSEAEVKFLAYHLADGVFADSAISVTESNPLKVQDWRAAVSEAFPDVMVKQATLHNEPTITYRLSDASGKRQTHSAHKFLRTCGLEDKHAADKFVPDFVFTLRRPLVALFLNRYLGCDGAVHADGVISFSSASERMLRQVSHLLLRFGAFGRIRSKIVKGVTYWEWNCTDASAVEAVRREVGVFTKPIPQQTCGASKHDRLPVRWGDLAPEHRALTPQRKRTSYITRDMGQRMFDTGEAIHKLAHSDLRWEPVVTVEPYGAVQTYDLTVPLHHTFIANDIVAHNTTDLLFSFPEAFFLAPPGALKPSVNVVGWDIPESNCYDPRSVPDATNKLKEVAKARRFRVVCVDDFSLLCELSLAILESKGITGWKLWGALSDEVLEFRDTARRLGIHVFVNMHERGPAMANGMTQRGGPKLPGKLPESFPAAVDMILRAMPSTGGFGGKLGWGNVYKCNPVDPVWVTGDRHGVTPDNSPMNLAEILRAAGYDVSRPVALQWMDRAVEIVASELMRVAPVSDAQTMQAGHTWLVGNMMPMPAYSNDARLMGLHARWALRDAYDRTLLARSRQNPVAMFGVTL